MATKKAAKKRRMDPNLIAANQQHEIDYVVTKLKNERRKITGVIVRKYCKKYNNSRRLVYAWIRADYPVQAIPFRVFQKKKK